jgi:signal recognition particle GTPase
VVIVKTDPKDKQTSLRNKYARRRLWAASALEQLAMAAEDMLQSEKTRKRAAIERTLAAVREIQTGADLDYSIVEKHMEKMSRRPRKEHTVLTDEQADQLLAILEGNLVANSSPSST